MMVILSAVLSAANIAFALFNAALQVRLLRMTPAGDRWLRILYFGVCLYWAGVYGYILINERTLDIATAFGQIWVRPAFTVTLALMTAGSLYRYRGWKK